MTAKQWRQPGERRRRGKGAEAARHHHGCIKRRQSLDRIPDRESLEGGHQAGAYAEADRRAGQREFGETGPECKPCAAGCCDQQQYRLDASWPIAVQQDAERQLEGAEGKQVGGGQQAQLCRRNTELAREFGCDDGVDIPQQVGKEITCGERQEEPQSEVSWLNGRTPRSSGADCIPAPAACLRMPRPASSASARLDYRPKLRRSCRVDAPPARVTLLPAATSGQEQPPYH